MLRLRLVPENTNIPFMSFHKILISISIAVCIGFIAVLVVKGLNFGVDFTGGILIEVRTEQTADLEAMRGRLGDLGLGPIALQEFGSPNDVLIRTQEQPGGEAAQNVAIQAIRDSLGGLYGDAVEFRRVEVVGPKVGGELIQDGIIAVVVSIALMLVYIWLRFELPFGVGSVIGLLHDVILVLGIYAIIGFEFSLTTIAAVLLIIGYSMNDTVVVYDRVRENLRKYKTMPLAALIDRSVNETLARTVMTGMTSLLVLGALLIFGGEVIRGFAFAMFIGVIIGTYSSIFIASASLLYIRPKTKPGEEKKALSEYEAIERRHRDQQRLPPPSETVPEGVGLPDDVIDEPEPPPERERERPQATRKRAGSSRNPRRRRNR
ncbi:MAG: protein translocase subunit SecF [Alphaproteobacteria bacterium]